MTIDEFKEMVRNHDLTYSYSDDGEVWRRGQARYDAICKAAKDLPPEEVERIWNAEVDHKLLEHARSTFYWRRQDTLAILHEERQRG